MESPKIQTASVKVMRSFDYCHFEVCLGTFYVWSPQWLQILKKIKIAPKTTFDASATPKVGQNQVRRQLQPLDIEDLKQKLAATLARWNGRRR